MRALLLSQTHSGHATRALALLNTAVQTDPEHAPLPYSLTTVKPFKLHGQKAGNSAVPGRVRGPTGEGGRLLLQPEGGREVKTV